MNNQEAGEKKETKENKGQKQIGLHIYMFRLNGCVPFLDLQCNI